VNNHDDSGAGKTLSSTINKLAMYIAEVFMWFGGIILIGITLLTVGDVFGRSALSVPIPGTIELVQMMLVCITFSGIVYTTAKNGHVKVELIMSRFSPGVKQIFSSIMLFIGSVAFAILSWQLGLSAVESGAAGLHTSSLAIPLAPFKYIAALCSGLTCLFLLKDFIFSLMHKNK
jgi:TRAP-type C4-dicarboxylate transport system permease small subunit